MPDVVQIMTTTESKEQGLKLAGALVERRLAACVQVSHEVTSVYRWEGGITIGDERQLWIKTTTDMVDGVIKTLEELHPYDVPEILVMPVQQGSEAYLQWVAASVEAAKPSEEAPSA